MGYEYFILRFFGYSRVKDILVLLKLLAMGHGCGPWILIINIVFGSLCVGFTGQSRSLDCY